MSLYVIGIGGTGAKCLEAIAMMASVGLLATPAQMAPKITLLFVDADETNGSLKRARESIASYQKSFQYFSKNRSVLPWMNTELIDFGLWSPFSTTSTEKTLETLLNYSTLKQNDPMLGSLFDVLFTEKDRKADLEVGFRGRPAIGSVVMSQVNLDRMNEPVWGELIASIRNDANGASENRPKIILFGSMFGGTGASGLPTIGKLLAQKLRDADIRGGGVPIACVFLLPYFSFIPSGEAVEQGEVFAQADQFLLSTEAALRYYLTQAEQMYDTVYLLGNQSLSQVDFSIGKQSQRNQPHFIELFAALAARHFLQHDNGQRVPLALLSRQSQGRVIWTDIPNSQEVRTHLGSAVRFAYVWLANIAPELKKAGQIGIKPFASAAPWFSRFYKTPEGLLGKMGFGNGDTLPDFDSSQQQAITAITAWCIDFLRWVAEIHQHKDESIQLFKHTEQFMRLDGQSLKPDRLNDLLFDANVDRTQRSKDTFAKLRLDLDENWSQENIGSGTVGLARAIYRLSQLSS